MDYIKVAEHFLPPEEEKKEKRRPILVLILSFLLWSILTILFSITPMPPEKEVEVEKLPERFAKIVAPELVKKKTEKKVEKAEAKKEQQQKAGGGKPKTKEEIRQQVRTTGILAVLGAKGRGGALADILKGGIVQNLDEVLGKIGGVAAPTGGALGLRPLGEGFGEGRGGGVGTGTADIGSLAATGGREVELEKKKEAKIKSSITTEAPSVSGEIDEDVVRQVAMQNMSAIKYCYDKALLKNPETKGKISVRITIGGDGRVIEAEVEQSTIDDQEMISCVIRMVRRWKFPATGSEVQISYPFIFVATTS